MSRIREIDIKNCLYYFFDDIINIKNLDPNNTKICNINLDPNNVRYVTPNSVKPFYLILKNINR